MSASEKPKSWRECPGLGPHSRKAAGLESPQGRTFQTVILAPTSGPSFILIQGSIRLRPRRWPPPLAPSSFGAGRVLRHTPVLPKQRDGYLPRMITPLIGVHNLGRSRTVGPNAAPMRTAGPRHAELQERYGKFHPAVGKLQIPAISAGITLVGTTDFLADEHTPVSVTEHRREFGSARKGVPAHQHDEATMKDGGE